MTSAAELPTLADLPIPENVRPGQGWTPLMLEMADHIGPYATLKLLERFGGEVIYFPRDPSRGHLREAVGEEKAAILSKIYGGERMELPVGERVLLRARRAPVLAAVRAGKLTGGDGARILKMRRTSFSKLVSSDEATDAEVVPLIKRTKADPRQINMFGD